MSSVAPVIQDALSDTRKRAAAATSAGVPSLFSGWSAAISARFVSGIWRAVRSVRMAEGERQFTRIFIGPTSCARWRGSIITPAFAAAYAGDAADADRPAVDAMATIAPARRAFMPGRKAFRVRKVAVRLWSMPDRQSSSVV